MKLLVGGLLLLLAVLGGGAKRSADAGSWTPSPSMVEQLTCYDAIFLARYGASRAELQSLAPDGWTVTDWGTINWRLLAVLTKRPARLGWEGDEESSVSLYQRVGGVLHERERHVFGWFGAKESSLSDALLNDAGRGACASFAESPLLYAPTLEIDGQRIPPGVVPFGWSVVSGAWSEDNKFLALHTKANSAGGSYVFGDQLSVYRVGESLRPIELWREVNMGRVELLRELAFRDLNADGRADVAYRTSCACNYWRRSGTLAATVMGDGRVVDMPFVMPPGRPAPRGPEDVDGDGRYEWRVGDASWESKGFGHATYPGSTFILEWNGFAYVDASPRFPEAIVGRRGDPLVDAASIPNLSDFVSRFLDYYNAGLSADAERMLATIRDLPVDDCTDHLRDAVVVALSDDPHRSVVSVAFSPPDPNEDSHGYCPYR